MVDFLYLLLSLAVCITLHEAAHAWAADRLGDPTARLEGRVSLNPLRHLDILGTLMIFIAHFGWGKPVPFNYNRLKHPRRDSALIAFAGPLANLLTAAVLSVLLKYVPLPLILRGLFQTIFTLSIVLFLFNLIPIAPLDGSKWLGLVLPARAENWYQRFLSQGPLYLILLVLGDRLLQSVSGFSPLGTYLQYGYEWITIGLFFIT